MARWYNKKGWVDQSLKKAQKKRQKIAKKVKEVEDKLDRSQTKS